MSERMHKELEELEDEVLQPDVDSNITWREVIGMIGIVVVVLPLLWLNGIRMPKEDGNESAI